MCHRIGSFPNSVALRDFWNWKSVCWPAALLFLQSVVRLQIFHAGTDKDFRHCPFSKLKILSMCRHRIQNFSFWIQTVANHSNRKHTCLYLAGWFQQQRTCVEQWFSVCLHIKLWIGYCFPWSSKLPSPNRVKESYHGQFSQRWFGRPVHCLHTFRIVNRGFHKVVEWKYSVHSADDLLIIFERFVSSGLILQFQIGVKLRSGI